MRLARPIIATVVGLGLAASVVPAAAAATKATPAGSTTAVIVQGPGAAEAVAAAGGHVTLDLPLIDGVAATVPAAGEARLTTAGFAVAPDAPAHVSAVTSGGTGPDVQQRALDLGTAWNANAGDGVGVALVDTGVADTADLAGHLFRGPDFSGEGDGIDHYGHGTFMAGLIAGRRTGVAPGATVVSIKVAGADGATSLSKVIAGIGWAVVHQDDMQLGVLSLSLGVDVPLPYQKDPLSGAVEAAWFSGLTVVVAAGNEGPGTVTSPGRDPFVVTVGAEDNHGTTDVADDTVAPWSGSQANDGKSRGKKDSAAKPEVVAPGTSVVSLRAAGSTIDQENPQARVGTDEFRGSGSSMSTAITAGAAAVLLERHPEASPDDVKGAIVDGARTMAGGVAAVDLVGADTAAADPGWVQDWKTFDGMPNGHAPWPGGSWVGSRWSSTRWSSTRWSSTRWSSTRWSGSSWNGSSWNGSRWSSTRWSDAEWASTRWSSTRWSGETWASTRWSSTRWSDASWGA